MSSSSWEADQRRSLTGYNIRDRARRALVSGADLLAGSSNTPSSEYPSQQQRSVERGAEVRAPEPRKRQPTRGQTLDTAILSIPVSIDVGGERSTSASSPLSTSSPSKVSASSAKLARAIKSRSSSLTSLTDYLASSSLVGERSGNSSSSSSIKSIDSTSARDTQDRLKEGEKTRKQRIVAHGRSTATRLQDLRGRGLRTYATSHLGASAGKLMHEHNLYPLPPPGHTRPVLLPTYAVREGDNLRIRIDGFVEVWPTATGTMQRLFNQTVRQLAGLPKLPRQQPAPLKLGALPPWSNSTTPAPSVPVSPINPNTDDATFFPEVPSGIHAHSSGSGGEESVPQKAWEQTEGAVEALTSKALEVTNISKTVDKVLQGVGALPVDTDRLPETWRHHDLAKEEEVAATTNEAPTQQPPNLNASATAGGTNQRQQTQEQQPQQRLQQQEEQEQVGLLGGSQFWAGRSLEEIKGLWEVLEHRLKSFWTYRQPWTEVLIEVVPVFDDASDKEAPRWTIDDHRHEPREGDEAVEPLLAATKLHSDAHGLFSSYVSIPLDKLNHYMAACQFDTKRTASSLVGFKVRALLSSSDGQHVEEEDRVKSPWHTMTLAKDEPTSVRVICDIDDTSKHTEVLSGSRAVVRNVFARPFDEVAIPGVSSWFEQLSSAWKQAPLSEEKDSGSSRTTSATEALSSGRGVDGWHFVTNAPAEMHGILKAYLCVSSLPPGHLALKHYPSKSGSLPLLQAYLQPAGTRKRQNLERVLDDFPQSAFVLVGDSGEMDLEVYAQLAAQRPGQIRGIWIRDVGNLAPVVQQSQTQQQGQGQGQDATAMQTEGAGLTKPPRAALAPSSVSSTEKAAQGGATKSPRQQQKQLPLQGRDLSTVAYNEAIARLARSGITIPRSTTLRIWKTGDDEVAKEALTLVRELRRGVRPVDR